MRAYKLRNPGDGPIDKNQAVRTLQALVDAGYRYDVDTLTAAAHAHGFTAPEVERLREYAEKTLAGHRFRITHVPPMPPQIVAEWERQHPTRNSAEAYGSQANLWRSSRCPCGNTGDQGWVDRHVGAA